MNRLSTAVGRLRNLLERCPVELNAVPSTGSQGGRARGAAPELRPGPGRCPFFVSHTSLSPQQEPIATPELELDHDGHPDAGFILSHGWRPKSAVRNSRIATPSHIAVRSCVAEVGAVWVGGVGEVYGPPKPGRTIVHADVIGRRSVVAARRSNSTSTREIRLIRVAITELPEESNVLSGHVIEGDGIIPGFVGQARILGEVWRSGDRIRSIDRREQRQIAPWIVQYTTTKRDCVQVLFEPPAVVQHPPVHDLFIGSDLAVGLLISKASRS